VEGRSSCGIEERQVALEAYADSICVDSSIPLADASEFCASDMQTGVSLRSNLCIKTNYFEDSFSF
jgi:hypothetical protein